MIDVLKMTEQKVDHNELERLGVAAFEMCERHQHETRVLGIDLDMQTFDALAAVLQGKPLPAVLGFIDAEHPGAADVQAELVKAHQTFAASA